MSGRLAALVSGGEIFYLGLLWMNTHDLAAPMAAGLLAGSVEAAFLLRTLGPRKAQARQRNLSA